MLLWSHATAPGCPHLSLRPINPLSTRRAPPCSVLTSLPGNKDGGRAGGDVDSSGDQTRSTPTTLSRPSTGGEPDGSVAHDHIEMDLNNGESARGGSPKKLRRRWTQDADVICVHAVRSAYVHRAPRGQRVERYGEAARIFNYHPQAPFKIEYKRYVTVGCCCTITFHSRTRNKH